MRSFKFLTVAVLVVALILVSAENAFAIQIDMHSTCGQPPPDGFTVTGWSGDVRIDLTTWGSGWEHFRMDCVWMNGIVKCTFSNFGTTGGFTVTITDDVSSVSATYTVDCLAVGGFLESASKVAILTPYVALLGLLAAVTLVAVASKKKAAA